ncbi:hypothetical protein PG985_011779 [Apiospora marii]|uniref:uncharacterized protein n=1 Tax=Apiospora marii TaxID=335849 RepID=UPI00313158E7
MEETSVAYEELPRPPKATQAVAPMSSEGHAVKVSRLLMLPTELRDEIYRHILLAPEPISLHLMEYADTMPVWYEGRQVYSSVPLNIALLLVNQQIYTEAARVLYSENTFSICDTSEVGHYVDWGWRYGQGRCHPREVDVKEDLVLKLFQSRIRFRDDKAKLIRRIRIVSKCGIECDCSGFSMVGDRWGLIPVLNEVRILFEGVRTIELCTEFPRYKFTWPDPDVLRRHMHMISSVICGTRWKYHVPTVVVMKPDIPYKPRYTIAGKRIM